MIGGMVETRIAMGFVVPVRLLWKYANLFLTLSLGCSSPQIERNTTLFDTYICFRLLYYS